MIRHEVWVLRDDQGEPRLVCFTGTPGVSKVSAIVNRDPEIVRSWKWHPESWWGEEEPDNRSTVRGS